MTKWADYLISAVHYDDDHSRIISVHAHIDKGDKVGVMTTQTRAIVVSNIENKYSYKTIFKGEDGNWKQGEDVRVIKIDEEKFIRTDSNNKKSDNLGSLPEY